MDLALIKPNLLVQAKGTGPVPGIQGIKVGSVELIDGPYVKLNRADSDDGKPHWIPLECVDYADDMAIYLKITESEYRSSRLDNPPLHNH